MPPANQRRRIKTTNDAMQSIIGAIWRDLLTTVEAI